MTKLVRVYKDYNGATSADGKLLDETVVLPVNAALLELAKAGFVDALQSAEPANPGTGFVWVDNSAGPLVEWTVKVMGSEGFAPPGVGLLRMLATLSRNASWINTGQIDNARMPSTLSQVRVEAEAPNLRLEDTRRATDANGIWSLLADYDVATGNSDWALRNYNGGFGTGGDVLRVRKEAGGLGRAAVFSAVSDESVFELAANLNTAGSHGHRVSYSNVGNSSTAAYAVQGPESGAAAQQAFAAFLGDSQVFEITMDGRVQGRDLVADGNRLDTMLASPDLTGTPTAPTPPQGDNSTRIPTTAFVQQAAADAAAALAASAPETLDSLNELAAAIGDDPNFAASTATALGLRLEKGQNLADLTDKAAARSNLELGSAAQADSTAFASAAQGAKADTSQQPDTNTRHTKLTVRATSPSLELEDADGGGDADRIWRVQATFNTGDGVSNWQVVSGGAGFGTGGVALDLMKSAGENPYLGLASLATSDAVVRVSRNLSSQAAHGFEVNAENVGDSGTALFHAKLPTGAGSEQDVFRVTRDGVVEARIKSDGRGHLKRLLLAGSASTLALGIEGDNQVEASFKRVETGAVSRLLTERLWDVRTPEDFGAAGDDVTDDTAAFVAGLAAGKMLWCNPDKIYRVGDVTVPLHASIFGNGARFKRADGARHVFILDSFQPWLGHVDINGEWNFVETTVAVGKSAGSASFTLADASGVQVGMWAFLETSNEREIEAHEIISVVGNAVTFSRSVEGDVATGAKIVIDGALVKVAGNDLNRPRLVDVIGRNCLVGLETGATDTDAGNGHPLLSRISMTALGASFIFNHNVAGEDSTSIVATGGYTQSVTYAADGSSSALAYPYKITSKLYRGGDEPSVRVFLDGVKQAIGADYTVDENTATVSPVGSWPASGEIRVVNREYGAYNVYCDVVQSGGADSNGRLNSILGIDANIGFYSKDGDLFYINQAQFDTCGKYGLYLDNCSDYSIRASDWLYTPYAIHIKSNCTSINLGNFTTSPMPAAAQGRLYPDRKELTIEAGADVHYDFWRSVGNYSSSAPGQPAMEIYVPGGSFGGLNVYRAEDDSSPVVFLGRRARGAHGAKTALAAGDDIVSLRAMGYDGSDHQLNAEVRARTSQTHSASQRGTDVEVVTTPYGSTATSLHSAFRTTSAGDKYLELGGLRLAVCAGTPEGQITAPVGSLALRTDGGAGTCLYVKESGTGATGWVAK